MNLHLSDINYLDMQLHRNTFLLLSSFTLLFILSCGDDDSPASPDDLLIGTWTNTGLIASECPDPSVNFQDLNRPCETNDCVKITFTRQGTILNTYTLDPNEEPEIVLYETSGNQLVLNISPDDTLEGTFRVDNDELIIIWPDLFECVSELRYSRD